MIYSAHNPTYMQRISLESNSEQLSQTTSATTVGTAINNYNHHCHSLEEEGEGESQENVYHLLENPEGDDVYEVLDKYENFKKEEDEKEAENIYHILDGPTVIEEESEGVATLTSCDITGEDHKTILQTSTSTDGQ